MISSNLPSNFANTISPYSPLGSQPVGEENQEFRNSPFKPVEASAESARLEGRRGGQQKSELSLSSSENNPQQAVSAADESDPDSNSDQQLLQDEQEEVRRLAERDRDVRQHERAHAAVGGQLTGAPSFDYERGPDGVSYAVSGEVPIQLVNAPDDPQRTLELARQARRAALAPDEPSSQDRQVAAVATQIELQAAEQLADLERQQQAAEQDARELQAQESQAEAAERDAEQQIAQETDRQLQEDVISRQEQQEAERKAAEAQQRLDEINRRSFELNQRILSIALTPSSSSSGSLLDQTV